MLAKLLKYEIPAMGRKLLPLYLAWLASSILFGLSLGSMRGSVFFEIVTPVIYGIVTTAVFVMFIILIIQRYNSSLLGDEAYFNLTLPVTASEHIANKAVSAVVWTVITGLAALASVLIIGITSGGMSDFFSTQTWRDFINELSKVRGSAVLVCAEILIVSVFSTVKSILAVYAAITIGHQAGQRTTLASIGAYIVLAVVESSVGSTLIRLGIITDTHIGLSEMISNISFFHFVMLLGLIVTLALSACYFFICKYLMEKRLNLA